MKKIYVFLILSARNNNDLSNPFILWPLPKINLVTYEKTVEDALASLLKESTGLEILNRATCSGWVILQPCQIYNNLKISNDIWIPYYGVIPEQVETKDGYEWRSILDIHNDDSLKLEKDLLFTIGAKL